MNKAIKLSKLTIYFNVSFLAQLKTCPQTDISEALVNMGVKRLFSKSRSKGPELDKMFSKSDVSADRLLHTAKVSIYLYFKNGCF